MIWEALNYQDYLVSYPQFSTIAEPQMLENYNEAQLMAQPLVGLIAAHKPEIRQTFVNRALSHVNQIYLTGLAGRLTSATTATISGDIEYDNNDSMAAYWNRTVYGQSVWQIAMLKNQMGGSIQIAISGSSMRRCR